MKLLLTPVLALILKYVHGMDDSHMYQDKEIESTEQDFEVQHGTDNFSFLPSEMVNEIRSHLDVSSIIALKSTSKFFDKNVRPIQIVNLIGQKISSEDFDELIKLVEDHSLDHLLIG